MTEKVPAHIVLLDSRKDEAERLKRIAEATSQEIRMYRCSDLEELGALADTPDLSPDLLLIRSDEASGEMTALLDELGTLRAYSLVPKIVLTERKDEAFLSSVYRYGAHSYLYKPKSYRELVALIRATTDYWFNTVVYPRSPNYCYPTILMVEDEDTQIFLVRGAMEELGFLGEMVFVKDGLDAVDYLNGKGDFAPNMKRPDLIVLDLKMPRMTGLEFLDEKEKIEDARSIPVVVVSFSSSSSDISAVCSRGAHSCIPYDSFVDRKKQRLESVIQYWHSLVLLPDTADE